MIKSSIRYGLGLFLFACLSCSKELKLPDTKKQRKISLIGELVANESTYFRGGQSTPVSSGSSLKFELLQGLSATITNASGFSLTLAGVEDSFSKVLYTVRFSDLYKIAAGNIYTVKLAHQELGTAVTNVTIPGAFKAVVVDTATTVYASDTALAADITIDDPDGDSYFAVEAIKQPMSISAFFSHNNQWLNIDENRPVYDSLKRVSSIQLRYDTIYGNSFQRVNIYTNDINTENLKDHSSFNIFRRVLLSDYKFSGSSYTTRVYLSKSRYFFDSTDTKGRVLLQVKSVSKDYFDYLKAYELYDPTIGFSAFSPPADIKSPIQNGTGVLGGVYKLQFIYILDRWEF